MTHVTIVASPVSGPPLPAFSQDLVWPDEAGCAALAARLANLLRPSLLAGGSFYVELHGTLGAGKTTFTRHLLRALGVAGRIKSPSYAVVEPHELPGLPIHHFDFYRFNDPQEWEDAGFRDLFAAAGLKLAEWPEKAQGLLPLADLRLHIRPSGGEHGEGDGGREVRIEAPTPAGHEVLTALASQTAPEEAAGAAAHG